MPLYSVRIKVSPIPDRLGPSNLPVDMLRRDRLYPATEHDASLVHSAISDPLALDGKTSIELAGLRTTKQADITVARWQSFGWQVDKIELNKL